MSYTIGKIVLRHMANAVKVVEKNNNLRFLAIGPPTFLKTPTPLSTSSFSNQGVDEGLSRR